MKPTGVQLYKYFKTFLNNNLAPRYYLESISKLEDGRVKIKPNTATIRIGSAGNPLDRSGRSGEYRTEKALLTFNIFTDRVSESAIEAGDVYCREVTDALDTLVNTPFTVDGYTFNIVKLERKGRAGYVGVTPDEGICAFSINYILYY